MRRARRERPSPRALQHSRRPGASPRSRNPWSQTRRVRRRRTAACGPHRFAQPRRQAPARSRRERMRERRLTGPKSRDRDQLAGPERDSVTAARDSHARSPRASTPARIALKPGDIALVFARSADLQDRTAGARQGIEVQRLGQVTVRDDVPCGGSRRRQRSMAEGGIVPEHRAGDLVVVRSRRRASVVRRSARCSEGGDRRDTDGRIRFPASIEPAGVAIEDRARVFCQSAASPRRGYLTLLLESSGVPVSAPRHSGGTTMIRTARRGQVKLRDCRRKRGHERDMQGITTGEAVEQRVLVESVHLDHPVDGHARAAEGKRSVRP